jgi:hypothetical protein
MVDYFKDVPGIDEKINNATFVKKMLFAADSKLAEARSAIDVTGEDASGAKIVNKIFKIQDTIAELIKKVK